jgi:glutamate carboxypeptidase
MLAMIEQLVQFESPSSDAGRLNALADHLAERFASLGTVERHANPNGGDHVSIHVPAPHAPADARPALVLCHFDTVWPVGTLVERPFRVEGEVAYGPGAYDMKASFALAYFALRAVGELGLSLPRPVHLLFTSDEEIGSPAGRPVIEAAARRAAYTLVLEPPVEPHNALKTARKGGGHFVVELIGRAAHAGVEPEKGASAVSEMAHQILALNALNDPAQGSTVNVGVAQGGTRPNVVPAYARLDIDVRAWSTAEAERLTKAIHGLTPVTPGVQLRVEGDFRRPPMERTPVAQALFKQAQAIGATLDLQLTEDRTGGGSDGNFTAALGIPTLDGLGTPGSGAHADHEQFQLPKLFERAALLTALLTSLEG